MNIDPQKDAEIRHLENGMEKAPKKGMQITKKVLETAAEAVKAIVTMIATKGKGKGANVKAPAMSKGGNTKAGSSNAPVSPKKECAPSRGEAVKKPLKDLVSAATKTASKVNQEFIMPAVTEKTR